MQLSNCLAHMTPRSSSLKSVEVWSGNPHKILFIFVATPSAFYLERLSSQVHLVNNSADFMNPLWIVRNAC